MRITSLIMAASAAGLVSAYPKRDIKKRDAGFTCMSIDSFERSFFTDSRQGSV